MTPQSPALDPPIAEVVALVLLENMSLEGMCTSPGQQTTGPDGTQGSRFG